MIDLIVQYKNAKKLANQIDIDPCNPYVDEAETVRGMISDINYSLEWMKTGTQPNSVQRGTGSKSIYTKRLLLNLGMFPCLDLEPQNLEQERKLSDHKKRVIRFVLAELTERQLTCFLLHVAHMRTHEEIAVELDITTSTVQKHIERAREKIEEIIKQNSFELD